MKIDLLIDKLKQYGNKEALYFQGEIYSYADLFRLVETFDSVFKEKGIKPGEVIAIQSDYSLKSIALLMALLRHRNIAVLVPQHVADIQKVSDEVKLQGFFKFSGDTFTFSKLNDINEHSLIEKLRREGHGGFVILSSGSTGKPKAILHDIERFLSKFEQTSKTFRTVTFLLFDHIAGLDTLFYILASGGMMVIPEGRDVKSVCNAIAASKAEVLPTSPTFLNLLCLSREYENHNLASLKIITYGSEPMSEHTLQRLKEIFPEVKLIQKYGTSEFGSPKSKSRGDKELWIQFDPAEIQTKVIENILWVKSPSTMLGYLNVENPIGEEGWYCTGDEVIVDGEWLRILGRKSDMINVGGEKVFPQEVENVILEIEGVVDALVTGEANPLTGKAVVATVQLKELKDLKLFEKELRKYCRTKLSSYKIPVKVKITTDAIASDRFKKQRR